MRVYELAKELGLSTKEIMALLSRMKVPAKSHSSSLDEATVRRVREQAAAAREAPPATPLRADAKTPTGERIISIRKIAPPPPAEAPAMPPAPAQAVPPAQAAGEVVVEPAAQPAQAPPAASAPSAPPAPALPASPPPAAPVPPPPAAAAPPSPTALRAPVKPAETAPPIRIAPVKPPSREAVREVREAAPPEEISQIFEPTDREAPPVVPPLRPVKPPEPKRPERRLPPPPPPRRFHAERRTRRAEPRPAEAAEPTAVLPTEIALAGAVAVGDLASRLGVGVGDVVRKLLEFGILAGVNQVLSEDVALRIAEAFGVAVRKPDVAQEVVPRRVAPAREGAIPRAPVVTVMGHVDHGKTTLLDALRATAVAAQEIGGITQHIGASTVQVDGRRIVFIDTPGHEAFTALRARGAQVTDITVLVVAADDGVMPQTVEAVNHARAAGVPIIVAINKVDLPQANPDRVRQQLSDLGLVPEQWGGDTVTVEVSARQGTGLKELLEMILLVAELHDLRANPEGPARGVVLETRLDRGRGPVATVLVQEGTMRIGDVVVAGETWGRVRALLDERGQRVGSAGPATPVEVLGLESLPGAGDVLEVVRDEKLARAMVTERLERRRAAETGPRPAALEEQPGEEVRELRLILKADVHGSVEALQQAIRRLEAPGVRLTILHAAVGPVTESDVMLAAASRALVVGFNVRPEAAVRRMAEQERVEIRLYRVIYDVLDDLAAVVRGLRPPQALEVVLGQAEVRQTFTVPRVGTVAGCYVTSGRILRGAAARLLREGTVIYQGAVASLRRFKEDVREVAEGFECGIGLERFQDIKVGDIIEAYEIQEVPA
ncbi:MAG: translation initiation factor IF-2 [Armatimonadota bacterium]|nr:translation initiation factor IF-2 [Armatimonadota bacterium]MDR7426858.1 translation initiation factor IF-2 [Armatimonadota bacterium]MDR7464643.1 translation initiation factor IF-2 [Armatimonadota bacterium]MDR7468805.1 translation initiation factor IF-2 [Armatimonadota bacterium]MDR7473674.1 translation initiation factor IF-2 [Armatimonadota bacterium]